jgi:uncharacterized membrane protein YhaH (DUF805 family)
MRFFTTTIPAGRLEYFVVAVILNVVLAASVLMFFELDVDPLTREVSYAADKLAAMAFIYVGFLAIGIINCLRRMKDLHMGTGMLLLFLIPIVNILFQLMLLLSSGVKSETYAPYGDDPCDPNSWVSTPTVSEASPPAVTFQGQALLLPGEDRWDSDAA